MLASLIEALWSDAERRGVVPRWRRRDSRGTCRAARRGTLRLWEKIVRVNSDMHDVLQRLVWAGGNHLLFDKAYHGVMEMRAMERAIEMGYAVRVPLDSRRTTMELWITPIGQRALAASNRKQRDACRGRAVLILRCRNAIRSNHLPFHRALLRLTDKALRRIRIILRSHYEFDLTP